MKNIFKLMGIALMASSMAFVACSDDDENIPDGVNVTFGTKTWTAANTSVALVGQDQVLFLAYEQVGAFDNLLCQFKYTKEKKYTAEMVEENFELKGFDNEKISALKYYTKNYEGDADWYAKTVTINVEELDKDNATFTATIEATMFNYEEWVEDETGVATINDVTSRPLKATAGKLSLVSND